MLTNMRWLTLKSWVLFLHLQSNGRTEIWKTTHQLKFRCCELDGSLHNSKYLPRICYTVNSLFIAKLINTFADAYLWLSLLFLLFKWTKDDRFYSANHVSLSFQIQTVTQTGVESMEFIWWYFAILKREGGVRQLFINCNDVSVA